MRPAQIVLIEDNPGDVLLVEMALRENRIDCSLTKFEDGQEAVRVLCGESTSGEVAPDAILLDLNTPRTDGFEALRSFKRIHAGLAQVPIAILTSSRAHADKQRAESQGARYIEKPSQLHEFLSTVGQAVREMLNGAGRVSFGRGRPTQVGNLWNCRVLTAYWPLPNRDRQGVGETAPSRLYCRMLTHGGSDWPYRTATRRGSRQTALLTALLAAYSPHGGSAHTEPRP